MLLNTTHNEGRVPLSLVIIPLWLKKHADEQGVALETLTDINVLSTLLSKEDIAAFLFINMCHSDWLGEPAAMSFAPPYWVTHCLDKDSELSGLMATHEIECRTTKLPPGDSTALLGPLTEPVSISKIQYRVVDGRDNTLLLIPKVSQTTIIDNVTLLDDLLYSANKHMSMERLAKLPMFRSFLYGLTARQ